MKCSPCIAVEGYHVRHTSQKAVIFRIFSAHFLTHNGEGRIVDRESLLFNAETKYHSKNVTSTIFGGKI
jgi:hypothetical protein